jgi:peroxiredoxin Q/BCP
LLTLGQKAPNFSLLGDDGQTHSLKDFLGHPLIIFFYPKDMTPGCTTEACDFSASIEQFKSYDAQVIGISKDSLASHIRFKGKHALKFLLLSDPDLAVHKLYGAYGYKSLLSLLSLGIIRTTVLIDKNGVIKKYWHKVRVKNHALSVLESLKMISA